MRTFTLPANLSPRAQGQAHGESFRKEIAEIAAIRTELSIAQGRFVDERSVLEMARAHLPVLADFDPILHEEFLGIAEGAELDPAKLVVLNHYTDLKDLDPALAQQKSAPAGVSHDDNCSAVAALTPDGPVLGQTWDMHGSAAPYVLMLQIPERDGRPASWLLSITGCLGMAGLNSAGVAVTINNLKSRDAKIGVIWPGLVRGLMAERSADEAKQRLMDANLGSGHHYLLVDSKKGYGIETSGQRKEVVFEADWQHACARERMPQFIHANHCVGKDVSEVSWVGETSTTYERHAWLDKDLESRRLCGPRDLFTRLGTHEGFPRSICTHLASEDNPHAMLTCAGLVMDVSRRQILAAPSCIHGVEPQIFDFQDKR